MALRKRDSQFGATPPQLLSKVHRSTKGIVTYLTADLSGDPIGAAAVSAIRLIDSHPSTAWAVAVARVDVYSTAGVDPFRTVPDCASK